VVNSEPPEVYEALIVFENYDMLWYALAYFIGETRVPWCTIIPDNSKSSLLEMGLCYVEAKLWERLYLLITKSVRAVGGGFPLISRNTQDILQHPKSPYQ